MDVDEFHGFIAAGAARQQRTDGGAENGESREPARETHLLPTARPVKVSATIGTAIDRSVISYPLYNSFNYSVFVSKDREPVRLSLGITSPSQGEGKTTVTCNLAAALSMASGRRTVVVDLNLVHPRIHEVFGTPRGPGLAEALIGEDICVVPTQMDNVFALPIGNTRIVPPNRLPVFREVLSSLLAEFDFVLVDLPAAGTRAFPTLIANQLGGLLVVVRSHVTRRREVGRLFRRVREENVIGFVMNGVNEDDF